MVKNTKKLQPFILILTFCILVSAFYYIWYSRTEVEPVSINEISPTGLVSLSLFPATGKIRPGIDYMVEANVSSGAEKVSYVQMELEFDPTSLALSNLVSTTYLSVPLISPSITNGLAKIAVGAEPSSHGLAGDNKNFATFKLKALKPGTHTVSFGAGSVAYATSQENNSLKAVTGITVQALNPGDITGNNEVGPEDYNQLVSHFGETGAIGFSVVDLNNNGEVDAPDYNILVTKYGTQYP